MRGCLSVLVLAAAFVLAVVWFAGPPLAATIVKANLTGSGLTANDLEVSVSAAPPWLLALGRADAVTVEGSDVRWNDLRAESLSLTLGTVNLLDRTAVTAAGFLDGVDLAEPGAPPIRATVAVSGPADAAGATVRIEAATVEELVMAGFERGFGSRPEAVTLVGPNIMRIQTPIGSIDGTLEIDGEGSIVLRVSLGTIRLVEGRPSTPIALTGLEVRDGALELSGTINIVGLMN